MSEVVVPSTMNTDPLAEKSASMEAGEKELAPNALLEGPTDKFNTIKW